MKKKVLVLGSVNNFPCSVLKNSALMVLVFRHHLKFIYEY